MVKNSFPDVNNFKRKTISSDAVFVFNRESDIILKGGLKSRLKVLIVLRHLLTEMACFGRHPIV